MTPSYSLYAIRRSEVFIHTTEEEKTLMSPKASIIKL